MKCLIIDDERPALRLLEAYIAKLPQLELVAACESATGALSFLQKEEIDLIFLDIQMPDLTGLELVRTLNRKPQIIFVTAYAEHAVEGFELEATDYLVKPVAFDRFVQALNRASERYKLQNQQNDSSASATEKDHFFVKSDYKLVKIYFNEIEYLEGMGAYIKIHTADNRHVIHQTMKKMESQLDSQKFMRVHKSFIVALDKITSVYGNTIEIGDKEIPIGKSYREGFFRRIDVT